jgi:hypothetical protein
VTEVTKAEVEKRLRAAVAGRQPVKGLGHSRRTTCQTGQRAVIDRDAHERDLLHAAEALSWLDWLSPEEAAIVLARLEGARWKMICWRFGIGRATAHRRWRRSVSLIASRLNSDFDRLGLLRPRFGKYDEHLP